MKPSTPSAHPSIPAIGRFVVPATVLLSFVSFWRAAAIVLIPDEQRQQVQDNLISGITMVLVGPQWLRLAFQAFVVVVGVLILSAAVNTSIIGSNGVLNRVAEDGVLPEWFREPQRRYGTTYRIIAMVAILQIATVIISRGDVTLLGEAYAFGVAWSFAMKALAVTVLRFSRPDAERWRVPLNLRLGQRELPVGLMLITALLFLLAGVNLFTKQSATIGGVGFTVLFFILLTIAERRNRGSKAPGRTPDRFRLEFRDQLSPGVLGVRPDGLVVGVHDPDQLAHLNGVLERSDPDRQDVILVAVKPGRDDLARMSEPDQVVGDWEVRVFSTAVKVAEDLGKPVALVGLVGERPYGTVLQAALSLRSANVVMGASEQGIDWEADQIRQDWRQIAGCRGSIQVEIKPDDEGASTRLDLTPADARPHGAD